MPPEAPASISFGVLRFDGPLLLADAGKVWKTGEQPTLRISWDMVDPPAPWRPIGALGEGRPPLAWVRLRGEQPDDRVEVENLGPVEVFEAPDGRWQWRDIAEGAGLMTLTAPDPPLSGAYARDGRVTLLLLPHGMWPSTGRFPPAPVRA